MEFYHKIHSDRHKSLEKDVSEKGTKMEKLRHVFIVHYR